MRKRPFLLGAALLCSAYLVLEVAYILQLPLVMDEFGGANTVLQFGQQVPYKDFMPGKTVLGYYIQLPLLAGSGDPWHKLLSVKLAMAFLTAVTLFISSAVLRRWHEPTPVLLSLLLLVVMSTFLERSAALRVDMLASLAALVGLLLILSNAFVAAGLLTAVSFLITQKAAYFVIAGFAGAVASSRPSWKEARKPFAFAASAATALGIYLVGWSVAAGPENVLRGVFLDPRVVRIAVADLYDIHARFWVQTVTRNPVFYLLSIAGLALLTEDARRGNTRSTALLAYAGVLALFVALHQQPWPYFFLFIIPTLFVVNTHALDRMRPWFDLQRNRSRRLALMVLIGFGVLYPLTRVPVVLSRSNAYQRETLRAADAILDPNDRYLDGVGLVYHHEQSLGTLRWLDVAALHDLHSASPAQQSELVAQLGRSRTKLVIYNYRMDQLPPLLSAWVGDNFEQLGGNLYIYSPLVRSKTFTVDYAGVYQVRSRSGLPVEIDETIITSGDVVTLTKGQHRARADAPFRVQLRPDIPANLIPTGDPKALFPHVYSY